jgi:hypothetical protein
MQTVTIVLFTALIFGLFLLFLLPGNGSSRRPSRDARHDATPPPRDDADESPDPPRYPRHLN